MRDRSALRFADQLAVWAQQSAQQPGRGNHTDEQRDYECREQERPVDERGLWGYRENCDNENCAEQKYSGEEDQQILKTAGMHDD